MIYQAGYKEVGGRLFNRTKNGFFVYKGIIIGAIGDEFNGITNKNLHTAFF